ncbi:MAG TPA: hypothetical protein VMC09_06365 [Anaerolineales bacterium]|nr:hypothetical protein [Anaerolineales bacterium]
MSKTPDFDVAKAHRFFAADCFNHAWDLIDKPSRTPEEDRTMLQLGLASLWHWSQVPDRTPVNLSVGHWQAARIYALLGQSDPAREHGELCFQTAHEGGDLPFYLGYAYEALARAESVGCNAGKAEEYLRKARELSEKIPDPEDRRQLLADLATIK